MPQKAAEAAREHMPELIDGAPKVLTGKRLMDAADGLQLATRSATAGYLPTTPLGSPMSSQ